MLVCNPKPSAPRATLIVAAMAIATLAACVDEPMSPTFDDTPRDVPLSPSLVLHGTIGPQELDRLERESELGYPSAGKAGLGRGLADRDDEMDRLVPVSGVPDSTRPDELARSPASPDNPGNAAGGIARRLDLDIPEVCHRDSPALDFERGWISFDDDCDALLAAMDQLRGTVALNWDTATVMTEWDGVFLGTFGVERLYLHNRGLDGSLPPELGALDDLEVLSLGRNRLTGEIPPELGSMSDLERLYLQDNDLTGSIPPELGALTQLERLYLWRNRLTGEIPKEVGSMRSLERLNLGGNKLTGRIPAELGSLRTYLVDLSLWGNELTGPIPKELGNLYYIENLSLSRNKLTGEIPPELAGLRNLKWLYLYDNQLTGPIPTPDSYGAWEDLRLLWLDDNELSGPVPAELGSTDLYSMAISANAGLTGPLPLELQSLLLDAFYWGATGLCSPPDPSFQAWLESIDEENYSGGPVCDSGSGGGTRTYQTGETISTLPTGFWTADVLSGASFQFSSGQVTISFNNGGYIEKAGIRYTCRASGGCRVVNRVVAQGTIEASGGGGGGGSNRAPVRVGSIPDTVIAVGDSIAGDASEYFSDPDGDELSYRATSSNTSVATVRLSGSMGTVTAVAEGRATIRVTATDPGGLSAEQSFAVTVEGGGGTRTYQTGETISTLPTGFWTADVLSGASFQFSSGQVTISFNNGGYIEKAGIRYTCRASGGCRVVNRVVAQGTIEASGGGGGGGSNRAPETAGSISSRTMTAGQSATLDASSYFSDPDGDRLTYTARSSSTSAATVSVSGSQVTVTAVAQGSATVRITATDPGELSAEQSFAVTVEGGGSGDCTVGQVLDPGSSCTYSGGTFEVLSNGCVRLSAQGSGTLCTQSINYNGFQASRQTGNRWRVDALPGGGGGGSNRAPETAGSISSRTMTAGQSATLDASSYFSDPDGDRLTYTARSSSTSAATVSVSGSQVTVTAVAQGSATVRITATDPGGLSAEQSFAVTVEGGGSGDCTVGQVLDPGSSCTYSGGTFEVLSNGCVRLSAQGSGTLCTQSINYNGFQASRQTGNRWRVDALPGGGGGGGGDAFSVEITSCSGTQIVPGQPIYRITVAGNVQARRSLSFVKVEGYANDATIGVQLLGSIPAGQSKDFSITGILSAATIITSVTCKVEVEATVAGSTARDSRPQSNVRTVVEARAIGRVG